MSDNNSDSGCGCITLLFLFWLIFMGGCTAIQNWTHKMNEPQHEAK